MAGRFWEGGKDKGEERKGVGEDIEDKGEKREGVGEDVVVVVSPGASGALKATKEEVPAGAGGRGLLLSLPERRSWAGCGEN